MHFCATHSALELMQDPDGQKLQIAIPEIPALPSLEVSKAHCNPREMCPQISKVYIGEHQALLGRRVDDANHRGTHMWLLLPQNPFAATSGFDFSFPLLSLSG